jgi:hypothetical protein
MSERQLDLFSAPRPPKEPDRRSCDGLSPVQATDLDDQALIAALPHATMAESQSLAAEAGRRRLSSAIPALEALCFRLTGYGADDPVPEQMAALRALALIGGSQAVRAVTRLLAKQAVLGPNLALAVEVAAGLDASLPPEVTLPLLHHAAHDVRANACRCVRVHPSVMTILVDLLDDLHEHVAIAAACALGRAGRPEARSLLLRALTVAPSLEVIEAVVGIADDEFCVRLGRMMREGATFAGVARDALKAIDHPRAGRILASLDAVAVEGPQQ